MNIPEDIDNIIYAGTKQGNTLSHRFGRINSNDIQHEKETTPPDQYINLKPLRIENVCSSK